MYDAKEDRSIDPFSSRFLETRQKEKKNEESINNVHAATAQRPDRGWITWWGPLQNKINGRTYYAAGGRAVERARQGKAAAAAAAPELGKSSQPTNSANLLIGLLIFVRHAARRNKMCANLNRHSFFLRHFDSH